MITEMIISIPKHDIESYPAIEFPEILFYINAASEDKVNNVQVAITCAASSSIFHP